MENAMGVIKAMPQMKRESFIAFCHALNMGMDGLSAIIPASENMSCRNTMNNYQLTIFFNWHWYNLH